MTRILPTYEAQRRVVIADWRSREPWQRHLWEVILLACLTPGIPVDDAAMQDQLRAVWGKESTTYNALVGED